MNTRILKISLALAASLVIAACSNGGSDATSAAAREPFPTLVQDTNPSGDRTDYKASNFFAANADDNWVYARTATGATGVATVSQRADGGADGQWTLVQTDDKGATLSSKTLRRSANGIEWLNPLPDAPAAAQKAVGTVLLFAEPFYAAGSSRGAIRQGDWGADTGVDGRNESFRWEWTQTFVGIESYDGLVQPVNAARFKTVTVLTLQPSDASLAPRTVTTTEESWWAAGVGLVKTIRSTATSDNVGAEPSNQLTLASATVANVPVLTAVASTAGIDGSLTRLTVPNNAVVYSKIHRRYYASIPEIDGKGNRIAAIHPDTGVVTYSDIIGSDPGALALSADGTYMYVGLNGESKIAKLNLPSLSISSIFPLPADANGAGQRAESIAVSPVSATTLAVSLERPGQTPRNGGVVLFQTGTLLPRALQPGAAGNLVAFSLDGTLLFSFDLEATAAGLSMMSVQDDGLRGIATNLATASAAPQRLIVSTQGIWASSVLYNTSGLTEIGKLPGRPTGCGLVTNGSRVACFAVTAGRLTISDATSLAAVVSSPTYAAPDAPAAFDLVDGPAAQVALRVGAAAANGGVQAAGAVWLFTSAALR